jgi:acyl-CoA synthetase (NDP forming)
MTQLMETLQKPVFPATLLSGATETGEIHKRLEQNHLTPFPTPERAATAPAHLVRYREYLCQRPRWTCHATNPSGHMDNSGKTGQANGLTNRRACDKFSMWKYYGVKTS